jgi:hypothetical protein
MEAVTLVRRSCAPVPTNSASTWIIVPGGTLAGADTDKSRKSGRSAETVETGNDSGIGCSGYRDVTATAAAADE